MKILHDLVTPMRCNLHPFNWPVSGPGHKTMLTAALTLMFNGPYSSHFIHSGQRVGCTSKVISRIIDGDASYVLPCFFK